MTDRDNLIALRKQYLDACKTAGVSAFAGMLLENAADMEYSGELWQLAALAFYANTDLSRFANRTMKEA